MSTNLKIDIKSRVDQDGRKFYVGKLRAPMSIDCSNGVTFLVFVSDEGDEQLQIAPLNERQDRQDRDRDREKQV